MKITQIDVKNLSIPLEKPKGYGKTMISHRDYTIVIIKADNGLEGWSYVFGLHLTKYCVNALAPMLIGEEIDITRLWKKMVNTRICLFDRGGVAMRAVAAIDIALWDLMGKYLNCPIYRMMGKYRDDCPAYYSDGYYPDGWKTKEELYSCLENEFGMAYDQGFRSFKMKIGGAGIPVDLERIAIARKTIGPESELMLDANSIYDPDTIIQMAKKFEKYDITWLEDPTQLDNFPNAAYVASRVSMPVATGEQNYTYKEFIDIIDRKAARVIMPDPGFAGGFTAFLNIAGFAALYGMKISPHCCHDLNVQLALARPEIINLEYMDYKSDIFNIQKVIKNPVFAENGKVKAPEGNGHGLILDMEKANLYEV